MATNDYTLDDASNDIADLRTMVDLLTEVHQQIDSGGNVPNTPTTANSHILYSNQGTPSWVNDNSLVLGAVGAQTAWFPGNTVTGTGLGDLAQITIPANDPIAFAIYEVEVWGYGTTGSANETIQFAVTCGGSTMASVTLGASWFNGAFSQAFRFHVTTRAICHTTGSSGTFSSQIFGECTAFGNNLLGGNGSQMTGAFCSNESTGTTTVNTTTGIAFGLNGAWGGTTGSPTMTSSVALAKRWC